MSIGNFLLILGKLTATHQKLKPLRKTKVLDTIHLHMFTQEETQQIKNIIDAKLEDKLKPIKNQLEKYPPHKPIKKTEAKQKHPFMVH
jgi:hypothetical protein